MPKVSEMKDVKFDGKLHGYVPPKKLNISSKLKLHTKFDKDIDPTDGTLNAFFEPPRHSFNLFQKFFMSRFGKTLLSPDTLRVDCTKLHIESDDEIFPQVDGEPVQLFGARRLDFSILNQKLRFVTWR